VTTTLPSTPQPSATERQRIFWLRAVALAGTTGLLALATPFVWAAVSTGLGLAALAGMALVGVAVLQALPLALQKLENRILVARKAEAQANPVEQLQNDCLRREQRLLAFRRALVTIGTQIESMTQMVQDRAQQDPGHVLDRQLQAIQRMRHFYECNLLRLNEAQSALDAFRHQVKQKMFEWEFAQAGQVVMHALNPGELEDLVQDLLTDAALRSVQDRFNTVFAELDVEMRSMQAPTHGLLDSTALERFGALKLPTARQTRGAA
jgi:hypothetical protein